MSAWMEKTEGEAPGRKEIENKLADEGLSPHEWGNAPNYEYGSHSHGYHKVLYCVSGSIVFHTEDGDFEMKPGDRLDVEAGTEHAATVGPNGVTCLEAAR